MLAVLGLTPTRGTEWGDFSIAVDGRPVTRNLHIAFFAETTDLVDAFHRAGVEAGYTDDGAPGAATAVRPDYYGGFLLDPDGNSVEAVTSTRTDRTTGDIDHLWLRTSDLAAAKAFYETIGPYAGFGLGDDTPDRVQFLTSTASFSFVTGDAPTEHVHIGVARAEQRRRSTRSTRPPRGGLREQRRARRARRLSPRLLRSVHPRPRRSQRRGRQPQSLGGRVSAASAASTSAL